MGNDMHPVVVADVGGTNIRLARLENGTLEVVESYRCRQFSSLAQALRGYLDRHARGRVILCIAIASPIQQDYVQMTNLDWGFSQSALREELALEELMVINDYTALAMAIPLLTADHRVQVGGGVSLDGGPVAVCGPGTGLGVAHLVHHAERWLVLSGEGGHVDFAPHDEMEQRIQTIFQRRHGHVSAERILSGPGLEELYRAICEIHGADAEPLGGRDISARAVAGQCPYCRAALERFCAMLGSFCGNLALCLGTFGGVYVAGGIIPGLLDFFAASDFRRRFEAKGRYRDYNGAIPTYVITAPAPGLMGAAAYVQQRYRD